MSRARVESFVEETRGGVASAKGAFEAELGEAVRPLQRALVGVMEAGGCGECTAAELARGLKIEQTLAWRVWRFANAGSGREAAGFLIGTSAMESFLVAARKKGVSEGALALVREGHGGVREFVSRVGGDEATFKMMLGALEDDRPGAALAESRIMFDANRLRIGAQAATQLRSVVMFPGLLEGVSSATIVDAFTDLWWMRANAAAVLRVVRVFSETKARRGAPVTLLTTPIEEAHGHGSGLPMMPSLCLGEATVVASEKFVGSTVYSISPRAIGRDHASTLAFGEMLHNYILPMSQDPHVGFSTYTLVPSEQLVLEVYVAEELVSQGYVFRPEVTDALFRPPEAGLWAPSADIGALGARFEELAPTRAFDDVTGWERYGQMVEMAMGRAGRRREEFRRYRVRIGMPPLGLMISLTAGKRPSR